MGAGSSRKQYNSQGIQQPGMILPPTQPSKIYNLQFILENPPPIILQPQQNTPINQAQNMQKLNDIKAKIIEYNKTWNFGNKSDGQPQSLLKKETYDEFLVFVTDLIIQGRNTPNQMRATINANAKSFQDKKNIVREIHKLVSVGGNKLVNEFFQVKMSEIFLTDVLDVKQDDTMMVNLLGLASIFGAEHIVIYLLMIGANPSITKTDNRDSATLMLSFQIGFYKLLQSKSQQLQQQLINLKYFIILPRILYILFLLGSIGVGVDLSAIFETNETKIKENNSKKPIVPVKSSILNMLAQMPGNRVIPTETARQTLQNGGSIPLLLEILEKNNSLDKPKFFKDVNSLEKPYDLNVLYSVLMNPNIDDEIKIKLTKLLVINNNANITNVPDFVVKKTDVSIFDRIYIAINEIKFTNPQTKLSILEIFSFSNEEFKDKLIKSGLLSKNLNSNTNKNAKIKRLETEVELLRQKNKLITNGFAGSIAALGAKSALINAEMDSLTGKSPTVFGTTQGFAQQGQQQYPTNPFGTNLGVTQQGQQQSQGLAQQFPSNSLSQSPVLQSQQIQQPGATLEKKGIGNRLKKIFKKGNNGQAAAQKNSQSNLRPVNTTLPQAASQMSSSTNLPQKPKGLINRFKEFRFGKNSKELTVAQPAPLSSSPTISPQSPILNTTTSSGLSQTVSPLSSSPNLPQGSALPQSSAPVSNNLSSTTKSSALLQPVSPLNSPSNLHQGSALSQPLVPLITSQNSTSLLPVAQTNIKSKTSFKNRAKGFFGFGKKNTTPSLSGGKKIQMRTYHFLKHKKYSERAFIAERPIIAADNAYDFMKLHYDIGSKKITFTIHDRVNNKKYKYTARTLKDGTNIIKSAK